MNIKFSRLVNSGSSANLVALSSLTSSKLKNHLQAGDEVVTAAVGFPTTVNPIFQNNLTPVFVDCEIGTYNPSVENIINACTKKTKAIFLAHTLGNPFEALELSEYCKNNNIWLIEDNCDALGGTYKNQLTGTFGDISTLSFYPAHHITMGEGGAVLTSSTKLKLQIDSFRDWGRDCWCQSGHDNTCNKRFDWQLGGLPEGYDHKSTYRHIGYNLKVSDMQAALGVSQLKKLDYFIARRRENFKGLAERMRACGLDNHFILPEPTENSNPSWFGFLLTIKDNSKLSRRSIISMLEDRKVGTRLLFAGNLIKQPAFKNTAYRVVKDLKNTDKVMSDSFWLGVWPGLFEPHLDYMVEQLNEVVRDQLNA